MREKKYQIFPPNPNYSEFSPPVEISHGENSQVNFQRVVTALIVVLVAVGVLYLAYTLFIKDCILLFKAKKQRTTTEIGFGQTPGRSSDRPPQP
ncbi:V2 [Chickpea redleaf virus]|uniref:Movement protein n=1 Tax=Chickpea redleaf virus TaxID=887827 RepID=E5DE91_9GEMI|nr:V2 [Chickpea redleaf virus]ADQ52696.1 V2 [Chickpea redleaf virus]